MSVNQSTGNGNSQMREWFISLLALAGLGVGMALAYSGLLMQQPWFSYPGWILVALAFLLSLHRYAQRARAIIWGLGLATIIVFTAITSSPYTPPKPGQPYTFALDASKIKSNLDILASSHEPVIVVLVVNNQDYSYQAQILQMALTGSPVACQFASPTAAPVLTATTTPVAASPSVSGTPCLNGAVGIVSVALSSTDQAVREDFMSELPNASTIYIFPASK
jgi:hypothetical protein